MDILTKFLKEDEINQRTIRTITGRSEREKERHGREMDRLKLQREREKTRMQRMKAAEQTDKSLEARRAVNESDLRFIKILLDESASGRAENMIVNNAVEASSKVSTIKNCRKQYGMVVLDKKKKLQKGVCIQKSQVATMRAFLASLRKDQHLCGKHERCKKTIKWMIDDTVKNIEKEKKKKARFELELKKLD